MCCARCEHYNYGPTLSHYTLIDVHVHVYTAYYPLPSVSTEVHVVKCFGFGAHLSCPCVSKLSFFRRQSVSQVAKGKTCNASDGDQPKKGETSARVSNKGLQKSNISIYLTST